MAVPIPEVTSEEVVVLCQASIESSVVEALLISTASVFVPCLVSWICQEQSSPIVPPTSIPILKVCMTPFGYLR